MKGAAFARDSGLPIVTIAGTAGSGTRCQLGNLTLPGKKAMLLISNGKSTQPTDPLTALWKVSARPMWSMPYLTRSWRNPLKEVIMQGAAFARDSGLPIVTIATTADTGSLPKPSTSFLL